MSEFRIKAGDIVQRKIEPGVPCAVIPCKHPSNGEFIIIKATEGGCFNGERLGTYNDRGSYPCHKKSGKQLLEPYQEPAPKEIWKVETFYSDGETLRTTYHDTQESRDARIRILKAEFRGAKVDVTKYVRAEE